MAVAAMQGVDQRTWVQYLPKGHFNMQTGEIEPAAFQ